LADWADFQKEHQLLNLLNLPNLRIIILNL